jgi:hypothetical protein
VHWCLGMYGSGSTWIYNVTRQIAVSVDPTKPVQGDFVSRFIDTARLEQPGRTYIVKSHEIDDEDAVAALSARADAIIVTIRDPRDAVTSLMAYHSRDFDGSLSLVKKSARLCARFASDHRSLLLRYEGGFIDDVTTLDRIAESFHQPLAAADRTRIFASSRRAAIEAFIAELPRRPTSLVNLTRPSHLLDPVTHWNTHHAGRTGEIGRWRRMLTRAQASEVERRLADFMDRFSYQPHNVQLKA